MNQTVSCLEIPYTTFKYLVRTVKKTLRDEDHDA